MAVPVLAYSYWVNWGSPWTFLDLPEPPLDIPETSLHLPWTSPGIPWASQGNTQIIPFAFLGHIKKDNSFRSLSKEYQKKVFAVVGGNIKKHHCFRHCFWAYQENFNFHSFFQGI